MIKSANDNKNYKALTLSNGLRVTLVQDAQSKKSAAALTVNVGHFDDPIERQGMAHFLEHMLFLGTDKYPTSGEFPQYISQHGGTHNAWTGTEHTSYFFDINSWYFEEALDRFGQFFISPLLSEELIEKERQSIEAEYKMKLKDDGRRIYQVHKETLNPKHPFSKFSVGNTETLEDRGQSIRHELLNFYLGQYQPSLMTLAVLAPEPIEETEQKIIDVFSQVTGQLQSKAPVTEPLYLPENIGLSIEMQPHKPLHRLLVSFPMPSIDHMYRNKTLSFISHIIGYEGKDSLLSKLKSLGWANGLSAGGGISGSNFKDYNISINLTQDGISKRNEIVALVFEFLDFLKTTKIDSYLYKDKQILVNQSFDYQEKTKAISWVSTLSVNMQHYPADDYIFGDYAMDGLKQDEVDNLLSYFTSENLRLIYIGPDAKSEKEAAWYHTPYSVSPLSTSYLEELATLKNNSPFALPEPNKYVQDNLALLDVECEEPYPAKLIDEENFSVWFKQDCKFRVPKGHIYVAADSPIATSSLKNNAMMRLLADLFVDSLIEPMYPAELAGMHYHIYAHQGGFTLHTSGLSANQPELMIEILALLKSFKPKEVRFDEVKHQLLKHWLNSNNNKPVSRLFNILSSSLQPNQPCAQELAHELMNVSLDEFNEFIDNSFKQLHLEVFMHGNWHKHSALDLTERVKSIFSDTQWCPEVIRPLLSLHQDTPLTLLQPLEHQDHALVVFFQGRNESPQEAASFMLLNHILSPDFFHKLRTEQQFGYLVGSGYMPLNRYPGLALYIQSPNYSSDEIMSACEQYLGEFDQVVESIDAGNWKNAINGLITQILEKNDNLRTQNQQFWMAIGNKDTSFSYKKTVAECIKEMTPEYLVAFAKRTFNLKSGSIILATPSEGLQNMSTISDKTELVGLLKPMS